MNDDPRTVMVTIADYLDAGLTLGLSASRTLDLYREQGGRIAREAWFQAWAKRKEQRGL